jgi:hypothetical protein
VRPSPPEYSDTSCIALPVNDIEAGCAYPPRVRIELAEKDIDSYRRARPEHSSRLVSAWTRTDLGLAGDAAELPINLFQVFLGILGLLYRLVKRAYTHIDQLGGSPPFQER